jgi:hypothetical protein
MAFARSALGPLLRARIREVLEREIGRQTMNRNRWRTYRILAFGVVLLAACADRSANAAQPALTPGGRYTRLLGAAPLKPPVLFADDDDAVAAKMETVNWYRYGAPTYAYYRSYNALYSPWFGYGPFGGFRGYYGSPFGPWGGYYGAGFYGGSFGPGLYGGGYYGAPFGYGYSPVGYAYPYGVGYRPWGAYPYYYSSGFYPAYMGGGAAAFYPPFGVANYGGCCYW